MFDDEREELSFGLVTVVKAFGIILDGRRSVRRAVCKSSIRGSENRQFGC